MCFTYAHYVRNIINICGFSYDFWSNFFVELDCSAERVKINLRYKWFMDIMYTIRVETNDCCGIWSLKDQSCVTVFSTLLHTHNCARTLRVKYFFLDFLLCQ